MWRDKGWLYPMFADVGLDKGGFHVIKREAENMKFRGPDFDSEEATTLEL
jgi:hypothetical protein